MHPASIVFFTTASGAGYGLLFWLGAAAAAGPGAGRRRRFGAGRLALALALVTAGLLASPLHLGNPQRAWRASRQWRSSWLSREGVAAVATYVRRRCFRLGAAGRQWRRLATRRRAAGGGRAPR